MLRKKDLMIISQLRADARKSLVTIAKSTGMPVSTIYDKLRSYEEGIIKKHSAILDFERAGFSLRKMMLLQAKDKDKSSRAALQEFLASHGNVNSAYQLDNRGEFLVDCVFCDSEEMQNFGEDIKRNGIKESLSCFITGEVRRENFLCNNEYVKKLIGGE